MVEQTTQPTAVRSHRTGRLGALDRLRGLLVAAHVGPAVVVTAAGALLGVAADLPTDALVLVALAVLTSQLTIGWSNDLVDLRRDLAVGRADKPLVAGVVGPRTVRAACAAALVACLAVSVACGWAAALVNLLCTAGGWAYNLGVKATAWSWLPYAVTFGALPMVPGLTVGGSGLPGWLVAVGALVGVAAHLLNVLPDLADDAATGVRGLPHRLGARASLVLAVTTLVVASLVVAVATGGGVGVPGAVALAAVAGLAATALRGRGRTPFRAAMLIVLVDVALVAWVL